MITTMQLQVWDAVARHSHVTRAAEELGLAQPSVTYHVRELERLMGVRLLRAVGRHIELTDAGTHLATRAAGILNDLAEAERDMREYAAGARGRLRLGATRTIGGYSLPPLLARFHAAHPDIALQVKIDNTREIERLLVERAIDLAVVEWQVDSPGLESTPLRRDPLLLIAAPGHPFAHRERVAREELRGQPFIVREPGSGTRFLAEAALGPIAAEITVVLELDQPEAIVRSVEAGLGLAFISGEIAARPLAAGTVQTVRLAGPAVERDFSIVMRRGRSPSPPMRAFRALLLGEWSAAP